MQETCSNQMWISLTTTCSGLPQQIAGKSYQHVSLHSLQDW